MIHTPEQLKEMSDHEINIATVEKLKFDYFISDGHIRVYKFIGKVKCHDNFNPCLSWNDVMTIAEKYKINPDFQVLDKGVYAASSFLGQKISVSTNPKRAICEVFLMMDIGEG